MLILYEVGHIKDTVVVYLDYVTYFIYPHPENQMHPVELLEIWISDALLLPSDGYSTSCGYFFFSILLNRVKQLGLTSDALRCLQRSLAEFSFHHASHLQFPRAVNHYNNDDGKP